jgi:hypothetical protein
MADWRPLLRHNGRPDTDVLFDSDGKVIFRTQQETQPVLDHAKVLRDDTSDRGWCMGGDFRRVASVPAVVLVEWMNEGIDVFSGDQQDAIARKLNDPDYFYLRTAPGRLGPVGNGAYR